jgi:predicted amidohydrolase YtcJ
MESGHFVRDASGELTGEVQEVVAVERIIKVLPPITFQHLVQCGLLVSRHCHRVGVTTMVDAGVGFASPDDFRVYQTLGQMDGMLTRVTGMPSAQLFLGKMPFCTGFGNELFRLGPMKFILDGSIQGFTALLNEDYYTWPESPTATKEKSTSHSDDSNEGKNESSCSGEICRESRPSSHSTSSSTLSSSSSSLCPPDTGCHQPSHRGIQYFPEREVILQQLLKAHKEGFQLALHTNGDGAIQMALELLEEILTLHPRPDHRHRLEHCQLPSPSHLDKMVELGIFPNFFR